MLLIDGVKYELWKPANEDELEQIVNEHAQEIFGENSIYFYKKQRLNSLSGIGTIPDGIAIILGDSPQWHIVEIELSSHDPYQHIVPQVDRFINSVDNPNTRNKIIELLYSITINDWVLAYKVRQELKLDKDIHKFLSDVILKPPTITIIIEKNTEQVKEALKKYPQKKVIEFQTFLRKDAKTVHAHLFEPLYKKADGKPEIEVKPVPVIHILPKDGKKVTMSDFIHQTNGIYILESDKSVTINVKKHQRLVEEQLAKQGLWTQNLSSFCWYLRKKAGLLNTPSED